MSSKKYKDTTRIDDRKDIGLYPHYIYQHTNIIPVNLFDIGSWNGHDANRMKNWFEISSSNVYTFEPNPGNFNNIQNSFPDFKNFNVGFSNFIGDVEFLCHNEATDISSMYRMLTRDDGAYHKEKARIIRMDDFIKNQNIQSIDICKVDVEGQSYELLEGFGDRISILKSIQIEAELVPLYVEEKHFFDEIKEFLIHKGFVMVDYATEHLIDQCDSLWIRKDLYKSEK